MANRLPKITIITPSYNQGHFIRQTIESVLGQNYPDLEYIVMDGGSTDNTVNILKKVKGKFKWFSEKDKGQSDAINKGIKISSGQILGFLNSDDYLERGALLSVGKYFLENKNIFWLTGKCRIINDSGKEIDQLITAYKNFWLKYFNCKVTLAVLNYISQPATFFRRKIIDKIGLFDNRLYYAMDYDYWLKASKIYKLGFIDEYLAAYRIYKDSKSGKSFQGLFDEGFAICQKHNGKVLSFLHRVHDTLIINIYKIVRNFT